MASGLALRNVLRRTKTTAVIGAIQGVTRPENLRMINLLDIHVDAITPASLKEFDRVAMVDVQPHYFGGLIDREALAAEVLAQQPSQPRLVVDDQHPGPDAHGAMMAQLCRAAFAPLPSPYPGRECCEHELNNSSHR